jgi:hypothetical protein
MIEDFEKDFFPNTEVIHLEVDLLNDLWEDLKVEITLNEWSEEEGIRYILASGLAALRGVRLKEDHARSEEDRRATIDRLQQERMQVEGRYAVMKYRTFHFMQATKTLQMQLKTCQVQLVGLRRLNEQLKAKLEDEGAR